MSVLPTTSAPTDVGGPRRGRLVQARDRGNAATPAQVRDAIPDVVAELLELRTLVAAQARELRALRATRPAG